MPICAGFGTPFYFYFLCAHLRRPFRLGGSVEKKENVVPIFGTPFVIALLFYK